MKGRRTRVQHGLSILGEYVFHGLWPTQRQRVITVIVLFKPQSLLLFSLFLCLFLGLCLEQYRAHGRDDVGGGELGSVVERGVDAWGVLGVGRLGGRVARGACRGSIKVARGRGVAGVVCARVRAVVRRVVVGCVLPDWTRWFGGGGEGWGEDGEHGVRVGGIRRTGCGGGVGAVVARGPLLGQGAFLALDGRGAGLDDAVVPGARQRGGWRAGEDAPRLLVSPEGIGLGMNGQHGGGRRREGGTRVKDASHWGQALQTG